MNKLWLIFCAVNAGIFVYWLIWARSTLTRLRKEYPFAFYFALFAAYLFFGLGWFGILGPPSEPIGGTVQDYEIWQARSTAAYGRSMVALLMVTVTYAVATFGILWNGLMAKPSSTEEQPIVKDSDGGRRNVGESQD